MTTGKWIAVAILAAGSTHAGNVDRYRIVLCGHIDTVSIPDMWDLHVGRAVSGREELTAEAGLGAAALSNHDVSRLNGKIVVTTVPPSNCLDLTGELVVLGANGYRIVKLAIIVATSQCVPHDPRLLA